MDTFQVHILAADKTFYEGPCVSLVVPTTDGERGILAPEQPVQAAAISPGMVKVEDNDVLVLVDSAERPEEIDVARAQREIEEAQEALLQQRSRQEHQLAQATLARALNRLRVKNMGIGR